MSIRANVVGSKKYRPFYTGVMPVFATIPMYSPCT
jgi:hypothetical protein